MCRLFSILKLSQKYLALLFLIICASEPSFAAPERYSIIDEIMGQGSVSGRVMQIFLAITVLGLAPSILVMTTSFVRISIVLSVLRTALGLQQTPPNQVLISLALFLTFFIMSPSIEEAYENGIKPMLDEKITEEEGISAAIQPFKKFMLANTRTKDLDLFMSISKEDANQSAESMPLKVIIPSFMISELRRAFEIGFLIFLPFLIIDIVVSSILMAMGMMMMPPVMVALPFKIIFFVVIDGWYLIAGSLVRSFAV
jgi:flagellar biosynthetic protein FliP